MKKDKKMNKNKTMKWAARALALCLAGTMAFAGAGMLAPVTVEAAPVIEQTPTSGNLTIKKTDNDGNPLVGATFAVYKIMSLTPSTGVGDYIDYEVVEAFATALSGVTPDALNNYSAADLEAEIQDLKDVVDGGNVQAADTQTTQLNNEEAVAVFNDLDLGYYLVVETDTPEGYVPGNPFLIAIPSTDNYNSEGAGENWVYEVTAEPKNSQVSVDKELADDGNSTVQDGSVGVGDYVKYEITTTIPKYPDEYEDVTFTIYDVMSVGLELYSDQTHPVTVTVDGSEVAAADNTYELNDDELLAEKGADLTVDFTSAYIKAHGGETVVVTYYAEVTEDAVTGTDGNPNDVSVTYNNSPSTTTDAGPSEVKVYSFNIQVVKFTNEDETKPLSGAEFELWNADMSQRLENATATNDSGNLTFDRLDEGTYYLRETKSPAGYTLLADPIKVEIIADKDSDGHATGEFTLKINEQEVSTTEGTYVSHKESSTGTAVVAVENHKGFSLPSTGGSGIALFLIIGAAGIITLSVVITKKTKKNS